ncbi:MAG TPA: hypothetical protein VGE21_06765 [Flavobacteriales bacterium]
MPSLNTLPKALVLLVLLHGASNSFGQGGPAESPYSAYGFGDMVPVTRGPLALMGGAGIAITEPFNAVSDNPASYTGMRRPSFDLSVAARSASFSNSTSSVGRQEAGFMGFSIGVPFGQGKWGLSMGLAPLTDVSYTTTDRRPLEVGEVKYTYTGTGGLDVIHAGVGRRIHASKSDSLGHLGNRLSIGANFNYIFGGVEQTRDALYPAGQNFTNLRAFSALNLKAPTGELGMLWQGDLTHKLERDGNNWRYAIGATVKLPVRFTAGHREVLSSYTVSSAGIETFRDSISELSGARGTVEWPVGLGFGGSISNAHWMLTAEARLRDFSSATFEVPGYATFGSMSQGTTFIAGARFVPADEGPLFKRSVYRAGLRYGNDYIRVKDTDLQQMAVSMGLSLPLNALQTNSYLHIGGEFGQRGTTDNGLVKEQYAVLWIGLTLTPWKLERWFEPYRIQ